MKRYIEVTWDHIESGVKEDSNQCAIAKAGCYEVGNYIGDKLIGFKQILSFKSQDYRVSNDLSDWIDDFDEGREVTPFCLLLDDETMMASMLPAGASEAARLTSPESREEAVVKEEVYS